MLGPCQVAFVLATMFLLMTWLPFLLVILSGLAHALWNILLKRGSNQEIFVWLLQVVIAILAAPLAIILILTQGIEYPGWWLVLGTSIIHILYFLFLSRSYMHADLSLVYPLARGIGPILVPILGVTFLDEEVTTVTVLGIMTIVAGIFIVYWLGRISYIASDPVAFFKNRGIHYAILTGCAIAGYSVWDKLGVQYVNPLLYMYLLALGTAIGLMPYMLFKHGLVSVGKELKFNFLEIIIASGLTFAAYTTVLSVLQISQASYVSPIREIGIVFSVILGATLLKEPLSRGRIAGSLFIVAGVFTVGIS